MDYKKFLAKDETLVLPYFGGTRVDDKARSFRLPEPDSETDDRGLASSANTPNPAPGWWRFRITGRRAAPLEPASPADLGALPAVRGHYFHGWIASDGKTLSRIALPPDDEPAPLSRVTARRWYSGELLFDTTDLEDEAELTARDALDAGRPLGDTKGVVPSLRAAFGYALGLRVARELRIDVTPRELAARVVTIAEGGREVVAQMFAVMLEERRRAEEEARRRAAEAAHAARIAGVVEHARALDRRRDPVDAADEALAGAGARMIACRRIERGTQLDVTYDVDGERILTIVDAQSLQVIDPGVCLANAHRVLTLDAMPSVIREAIEEDHLNITRHG